MMGRYDDIIGHGRWNPQTRPRMPRESRAAQFSPFAALTGYEEEIEEGARLTEEDRHLEEDEMVLLDQRLHQALDEDSPVRITWFEPDKLKEGGAFRTAEGRIRKVDLARRCIVMEGPQTIPIDSVKSIQLVD